MQEKKNSMKKRYGHRLSGDEPLWVLLYNATFSVTRLREIELAQFGLTVEQSTIIKILASLGGSTTAGLLEYLTMRQPHTISILINRMINMDLISRKRKKKEKRYKLTLTAKGYALLNEMTETTIKEVFSIFSEEENEELTRLLRILQKKSRKLLRTPFNERMFHLLYKKPDNYEWQHKTSSDTAWAVLYRTGFIVARLRELELVQFDLTIEQSAILKILHLSGGSSSISLLQEITMRQHHSISTLIKRMRAMRLVNEFRLKGENKYTISITKKGEDLVKELTNISIKMSFSSLTKEEKDKLEVFLLRIEDKARNMLGLQVTNSVPSV
jgi:DNA-binding MarR family transcriptional regulator